MNTTATAPPRRSARQGTLAGTGTMIRLILRRNRARLPLWILGLAVTVVGTAGSFRQTYPTAADRETAADLSSLPAVTAMVGRVYSRDDYGYGVMMGHQMYVFTAVLLGLMSVLLLVRHTRAEEEAGRSELVRSNVLGRHAQTTAALLVVGGANLLVGLLIALGLSGSGLDGVTVEGSFLFGAGLAAAGLAVTGVTAVTCQVTEYGRGAAGLALAVLGLAYAVRAVGDVAGSGLSWLSPFYWGQTTRSFAADQRWWPLLLPLALAGCLVASAYWLSLRRDVGAGLRPPKPGVPTASRALGTPIGLAFRLQRASLLGWALALVTLAVTYGSLIDSVQDMFDRIDALEDLVREVEGATLVESWFVTVVGITAMVASIQATLAVLRIRAEERGGRAEPVLATAVSRGRWAGGHLAVAVAGSATIMALVGLGFGVSAAVAAGDASWIARMLGATLVHLPAIWVAVGFATAVVGLAPRAAALAWLLPGYAVGAVYLGQIIGLPDWTRSLSPFGHVPELPAGDFALAPVVGLLAVAVALTWAGLLALRRRDVSAA